MSTPKSKTILVTGDVFVDHHVYEGERLTASATKHRGIRVIRQHGGAAGLNNLISEVLQSAAQAAEKAGRNDAPEKDWVTHFALTTPDLNSVPCGHHALAVWKSFPKEADDKCNDKVWRAGLLMGYGHDEASSPAENTSCPSHQPAPVKNLQAADVLVLDDAGFVFRHHELENCWLLPSSRGKQPDWIVLKMSGPVCAGDLWDRLTKEKRKRLIIVVSAHELRQECVRLGKGLSWERTVEELCEAFRTSPVLQQLAATARHLVVTFSADGALWLDNTVAQAKATLIFDAAGVEGSWARDIKGEAFGYLSCVVASLVRGLAKNTKEPALAPAICSGLAAMRDLRKLGHGSVGDEAPKGFPLKRLSGVIVKEKSDFSVIRVPWTDSEWKPYGINLETRSDRRPWQIVESSQCAFGSDRLPSLIGLAAQVVLHGESAIKRLPHARFGKLLTADRFEIESLHGIERQMFNYKNDKKAGKPLSLGVFGPPGAGKSFGVRQIANAIFGKEAWLEFNLSQFKDEGDLIGAFHQVRDMVLSGATPVVFWDEFDSREYFWLQYLLAPMQDGRFQEGQINHFIGKCVFIFAGATSYTFAEFGPEKPGGKKYDDEAWKIFKLRKGPDFHSRLDAYFDVLGPNQRTLRPDTRGASQLRMPDKSDVCFPLRRGLLIRALLGVPKDARLDFDADLLSALLSTPSYAHGSRSLEKLILALKPAVADQPIRRSSLPPASVLAMHVDEPAQGGRSFEDILNQNTVFKNSAVIEAIAKAIHEAWLPFAAKDNPFNRPWAGLALSGKDDNLAAARRIPEVVALAGLEIQIGRKISRPRSRNVAEDKVVLKHLGYHLERLAEAEHDGWMNQRLKNGWRYDATRDNARKLHPLLKPYAELPEAEKDKDRRSVLDYVKHVRSAGYQIVFA